MAVYCPYHLLKMVADLFHLLEMRVCLVHFSEVVVYSFLHVYHLALCLPVLHEPSLLSLKDVRSVILVACALFHPLVQEVLNP